MARLIPATFRFPSVLALGAQRVSLLGPFNNWTPNVHPLTSTGNGWWIVTIYLPPGRVAYCFDVDGTTWLDPNDHGRAPNGWGSEYSVRNVEPVSERPTSRRSAKRHVSIQGGAQVFECGVDETAEAIILRPSGEVDLATVAAFRDALKAAAAQGRSVVVDMSGIRYFDSIGVHALFDHAVACKQHDYVLMLAAPRGTVQKVIEMTRLNDAIPVVASVEVALNLVRSRTAPTKSTSSPDRRCQAIHERRRHIVVAGGDGDLLHIETEERPEGMVARVSGEVDLANVDHLKQAIQPVLRNGRNVILDLSHLRYIDSTGLYVLAYAHKALQQHNCQLVVVGASPTITKILRIFGLDGLAPLTSSLDDAMNLLRTRSSGTAADE